MSTAATVVPMPEKVYSSVDEIIDDGASVVEYRKIEGFKGPEGPKVRIGSVCAGDMIEWSEANEGEAKRTAGLRLLSKSLVGPEPENVRYALDVSNIAKFAKMRHNVTERIVKEILDLNGMTVKKDKEAKNA